VASAGFPHKSKAGDRRCFSAEARRLRPAYPFAQGRGIGLIITAANHVIHLSRWWNPAVEDRCNNRALYIGQTRDVTIHLPMAIHPNRQDASFGKKLHQLLEQKRALSRDMLAPPTYSTAIVPALTN